MRTAVFLIAAVAAVAACNKSPEVHETNASIAQVQNAVRESGASEQFMNPGKWQSKVTIESINVPGMPSEIAQRMKQTIAQARGFESCLTKEDVKQPKEDFFTGKNDQCRYDHFTMSGGKIDAVMRCEEGNGTQVMRMAGTYSPDSYQMSMAMEHEGGKADEAALAMKMRVEAHRVGQCTGNES
jgi:hypothetical protein